MTEFLVAAASAFWLGILTSISPCPLATNIAAISYIGRRVENPRRVLLAGLLYTIGRVVAYLGLAFLLVTTALSVPHVSMFLQKYMLLALGPVLVLVGMVLVGLIDPRFGGRGVSASLQQRIQALGLWGALLLGVLFALAFCPTSAALFFGSVVSAVKANSTVMLPLDLRHRHRAARVAVCIAARCQRPVGRQGVQCAVESRVVGSDDHRLVDHPRGHLVDASSCSHLVFFGWSFSPLALHPTCV